MSKANGGSTTGASASGYYVEVVHPSGHVHRPATMDDPEPQRNPVANALPTITIPVRRNEKWSHESFEDAEMRVWKDGQPQPIDRLEEVEQTEQATVLYGRGGLELKRRYQTEVTQQRTTDFVEQAISDTTGYTPNVDTPETTREDGVYLDGATRDGDFTTRLTTDSTDPLVVEDGAVKLAQSCYPQDGTATALGTRSGDQYNGGKVSMLTDEPVARFRITSEYDIPSKHVGIKIRDEIFSRSDIEVRWDGTPIARLFQSDMDLGWREIGAFSPREQYPTYQAGVGSDIRAGEQHLLTFHTQEPSEWGIDVVAVYDRRFGYSWPNPDTENGGGALSGPELYPAAFDVTFDAPVPPRAVVGAQLTATGREDEGGIERVGLSNTQGRDYGIESGTDAIDIDFAEPGPSVQPLVTLTRQGDGSDRGRIPTQGYRTQWLEGYQLEADLEDIPLVVNQSFDGELVDVLSDVASDANAVFEYRQNGDDESIKWTQSGQRTATRVPSVGSYTVTKSTAEKVQKAVVYGATRDVTGEVVVILDGQAGKTIDLKQSRLKQGSVTVENAATGATMREGDDYSVQYQPGVIETRASGRMTPVSEYRVSYSYQTYGEYAAPDIDSPRETVRDAAGLTSDFAAQQTAETVVRELQTPTERGTLTLTGDAGYSVVEALSAAELPGGAGSGTDHLQIREITNSPGETTIRIGNHRTFEEIVSDFEQNISAVEREV